MTKNERPISYTQKYTGRTNRLITPLGIHEAGGGKADDGSIPYVANYKGLWDTGATQSCISSKIVTDLGLNPVGAMQMNTAGGTAQTNAYHISVKLPNRCYIEKLRVAEAQLVGCDALIGMDVISRGNFTIINDTGKTVFEFSLPNELVSPSDKQNGSSTLRVDSSPSPAEQKRKKDAKRKRKLKAKMADQSRKRNKK